MRKKLVKSKQKNPIAVKPNSSVRPAMPNGMLRLNPSNAYNASNISQEPRRTRNIYDPYDYDKYAPGTRNGEHMRNMSKRITLNTGNFNFDKRAYKKDEDLKKIRALINLYNTTGSVYSEISLMEAARDYIVKNTIGDEGNNYSIKRIQHKGRMKMMEDILYQLTMRNGATADAATDNITRLKGNISTTGFLDADQTKPASPDQQSSHKLRLRSTMDDIKNLYKDNKYSKTMQMIAADVMSRQFETDTLHATGFSDSKVDTRSRKNIINVNANDYKGTPEAQRRFLLGTGLHEFTHMAVHDAYRNSDLPVAFTELDMADEVAQEINKRKKLIGKISGSVWKDFNGKKAPKNWSNITDYAMMRANYANNSGANTYYLPAFLQQNAERQQDNQNSPEYQRFLQSEQRKLKNIRNAFSLANNNGTETDYSNVMVEYEAVIPQMLSEFEYAGVDRNSKSYQILKAVALDSHVRRRIADLKNKQFYNKNR